MIGSHPPAKACASKCELLAHIRSPTFIRPPLTSGCLAGDAPAPADAQTVKVSQSSETANRTGMRRGSFALVK